MTNTTETSLITEVSWRVNEYVNAKNALLEVLAEVKEANETLNKYYESVSQRLTQDAEALAKL